MTAEIIELHCNTTLPVPPEKVLNGALEAKLDDVIVIGRTADDELYVAASMPDSPEILWLLKNVESYLLNPNRE